MNIFVCLVIFAVINYLGLRYITARGRFEVPSLIHSGTKVSFSGAEQFTLLSLTCAIIAAAPLGLLPVRLFLWIIFLIFGLIRARKLSFNFCSFLYMLYLIAILLSLCWSPAPLYGFRVFLKYLLPFLVLLLVPSIIESKEVFIHGVKNVYWIIFIYFGMCYLSVIGLGFLFIPINGVWWWGPAIVDSYSIFLPIIVVFSILFSDKRYLLLIIPMAISPLIGYVIRTGLVVIVVSAAAMAAFHYKIKSVPFFVVLALGAFLSVAFVPQLREKMFYEQYATEENALDYENWEWDMVDSNGRFAMWDDLLNLFYYPHMLKGSGAGAEQQEMYRHMELKIGAGICHCDYVQILCDNGLIGISLYGATLLCLIIHCFLLYNDTNLHIYCRYSAFIAGTGMCGMAAAMMTDNVVNYTICTLVFPFTFYAMALGLKKFPKEEEILPQNQTLEEEDVQCDHPALQ